MKNNSNIFFSLLIAVFLSSCTAFQSDANKDQAPTTTWSEDKLAGIDPVHVDGDVNVIIEIPAGTLEKWELDKLSGQILRDSIDGKPRTINYLGYPGNYGLIPKTLLSKEQGGDGDPLDIIVLGPPVERGSIVKCNVIGVLYLLDGGEQDDKLIAASADSPLYGVKSLTELNETYIGVMKILQLWFTNYKGPGKMESKGFGDKNEAHEILMRAIEEYDSGK